MLGSCFHIVRKHSCYSRLSAVLDPGQTLRLIPGSDGGVLAKDALCDQWAPAQHLDLKVMQVIRCFHYSTSLFRDVE
jgi:hypothetical protein